MGALKKFIKSTVKKASRILPGTGRHAAKRAEESSNEYANQARQDRERLEQKTKKERARAQKLVIKGIRSRRAASYFSNPNGKTTTYGSTTIG